MTRIVYTYEEAVKAIKEMGLLPLSPLVSGLPALSTITLNDAWHSDTEGDPWKWRTRFAIDGVAGYGKFLKKKSVLISRDLLPYVKCVIGSQETVATRYKKGFFTKEAVTLSELIQQEEGIDTRDLRKQGGFSHKDQKKVFEQALLELQGSMDIVISGIKPKTNQDGKINGWSSTAYETYDSWAERNAVNPLTINSKEAKSFLMDFFSQHYEGDVLKKLDKLFYN